MTTSTRMSTEIGTETGMNMDTPSEDILARLAQVIEQRKRADPDTSYVARLFGKGLDAILKKVGEEATETVMAAKDGVPGKVVYEVADLWFHTLLVLSHFELRPADVLAELARREGLSGLEEKAQRALPGGSEEKQGA
jgi:phosphoribosyl-ATP pyrophosphohydrolase